MAVLKHSPDIDFPEWYQEVLKKAELADNAPVKGAIFIRPYAYAIWELMQAEMDRRIKAAGAENAYFPLFIPLSYFEKEKEHVEGFSPELAIVTHAGGSELPEPLAVRPTSETVIGAFMSKWISSHRDLPLLLNQWANVVRWEKRPRAFLRTTEFLWQEGHTAHVSEGDAAQYARMILDDVYSDFMYRVLAIPTIKGQKPPSERFAGATNTMTCEGMMGDGKALQLATSHELGQNFARSFDIQFANAAGAREIAWTTSWGSSTRMMGGLFMTHGDEHGLRLPPSVAPYQVVIVQINDDPEQERLANQLRGSLVELGIRVRVDRDTSRGLGARVTDWEIKGVPLRVDLGAREASEGVLTVLRRDTMQKSKVRLDEFVPAVPALLARIQEDMLASAITRRDQRIGEASSVADAVELAQTGFVRMPWAILRDGGEEQLKPAALSVRCLVTQNGEVPLRDDVDDAIAIVARAY
ncbi:MAG: proline--tRNA ligase [Salinibacterium sp.]|nr:MAG: proline--tRNA ligase [Salinibacterium sp.]